MKGPSFAAPGNSSGSISGLARWAIGLGAAGAVLAVVLLAAAGPVRIVERSLDRLREAPPATGSNIDRRVLSISGASSQAEDGTVAVAVGAFEGKPKIYVNLQRLKSDAHELSADILKLSKVIG